MGCVICHVCWQSSCLAHNRGEGKAKKKESSSYNRPRGHREGRHLR
jgi:hypothetical protein